MPKAPQAAASIPLSLLLRANPNCLWYIFTASSISFILIKTSPMFPKALNFPKRHHINPNEHQIFAALFSAHRYCCWSCELWPESTSGIRVRYLIDLVLNGRDLSYSRLFPCSSCLEGLWQVPNLDRSILRPLYNYLCNSERNL